MMIGKLFNRTTRPADGPTQWKIHSLHSVEQFRFLADRERKRCDRTGTAFSLLALEVDPQKRRREEVLRLAKILEERLRSTDDAGLLDDGRVGVLLPETSREGAWKVADDVAILYGSDDQPPNCEVSTYPSDWSEMVASRNPAAGSDRLVRLPRQHIEALFVEPLPWWKRVMDVAGAAVGLVILSPLMAVIAVAVKRTSPGPVLFKQFRSGLGGRPFTIYKFRTMVPTAEEQKAALRPLSEQDGPAFKLKDDPRVTRLGNFLRSTSLDELPQLWNVLRGEMSLVGPRPLPCEESEACLPWQRERLAVTPGLTCIWQVAGRSNVSFEHWVRMDIRYRRSRTLLHDLKLILKTIPAVLSRKGAS